MKEENFVGRGGCESRPVVGRGLPKQRQSVNVHYVLCVKTAIGTSKPNLYVISRFNSLHHDEVRRQIPDSQHVQP